MSAQLVQLEEEKKQYQEQVRIRLTPLFPFHLSRALLTHASSP